MKKAILLGAFAVFALASCTKEYTCECVTTSTVGGESNSTTSTTKITGKKKSSKLACENGSSSSGNIKVKCIIK